MIPRAWYFLDGAAAETRCRSAAFPFVALVCRARIPRAWGTQASGSWRACCLFLAASVSGGMSVVSTYVLDSIRSTTPLALRFAIGPVTLLLVMLIDRSPWVRRGNTPRMALLWEITQLPDRHGVVPA